ncbi:MAG: hypothetical protein ACE5LF_04780 [Alphaproteobacteria bacterium]
MQATRWILYVFGAMFVLSAVLVFVPWGALNAFVGWFGPYAYPDEPLVQYSIKAMLALFFWIGVLMFVVVARPEKYPVILLVFAYLFLSFAVVALGLGWAYAVPWFFYIDAVSSAVIGVLFLAYRAQATKRGASEA